MIYSRWDTRTLHNFYLSLLHDRQMLENKMELVRQELERRVKARPLPDGYRPGMEID